MSIKPLKPTPEISRQRSWSAGLNCYAATPESDMSWQPMTTAPRDGTVVLVTETPNGEHYNVLPAMYANMGGGDPRMGQKAEVSIGWWAACGSRYTGEGGDCDLPVRWKALACTPICWMPMPAREDEKKLRRRLGQLLRHNTGLPARPAPRQTLVTRCQESAGAGRTVPA